MEHTKNSVLKLSNDFSLTMCHEDTDDEFNILTSLISVLLFSLINLIVLLLNISVCVYYKRIKTKVVHCQTDFEPDHKIVVIHPNDDLQLIAD